MNYYDRMQIGCSDFSYQMEKCPDGLYQNPDGTGFILVMTSYDGRYAIQLDEHHDIPIFGYQPIILPDIKLGKFIGKLYPGLGAATTQSTSRRCGLLVRKNLRLYLKANDPEGKSKLIRFPDIQFNEPSNKTQIYFQWYLYMYKDTRKEIIFYPYRTATRCHRYIDSSWKWARDFGWKGADLDDDPDDDLEDEDWDEYDD